MAANEHLSPDQFFHGTNAELEPGSYLTPQGANKYGRFEDESGRGHVYFTADKFHAYGYAVGRAQQRGGKPNVYQVEPMGKVEPDPSDEYDSGRTRARMRVIGRADV